MPNRQHSWMRSKSNFIRRYAPPTNLNTTHDWEASTDRRIIHRRPHVRLCRRFCAGKTISWHRSSPSSPSVSLLLPSLAAICCLCSGTAAARVTLLLTTVDLLIRISAKLQLSDNLSHSGFTSCDTICRCTAGGQQAHCFYGFCGNSSSCEMSHFYADVKNLWWKRPLGTGWFCY